MKKYSIIIFFLVINTAISQVNFRTAESQSGIIGTDFVGLNVGYSFSSSEANFTFSRNESVGSKFKGNSFRVTVPVSDGSRQLFVDGNFNPGVEVSYDHSWSGDEFDRNLTYYFLRFGYEIAENRFGFIDSNDTIRIDERLTQKFGISFGANFISTNIIGKKSSELDKDFAKDNLIIAGFVSLEYNTNPVVDLRNREFVIQENTGVNGAVQQTINAFQSEQEDFLSITPKIDFVWTPIQKKYIDTEETLPRIGILSSLSSRYNTQSDKFAWNFSVGPSLHPKNESSRVIAALLAEFRDFNNSTGNRDFDDIFSVNLYIGIPISFRN
ncbi:MAG: hypothetical protein AAGA43_12165 [Bacteroidota bacterium]